MTSRLCMQGFQFCFGVFDFDERVISKATVLRRPVSMARTARNIYDSRIGLGL